MDPNMTGGVDGNKGSLEDYMTQMEGGSWLCLICQKPFTYKGNLKCHIQNVHQPNQQVRCPVCKSIFKNQRSLKVHSDLYHKNKTT